MAATTALTPSTRVQPLPAEVRSFQVGVKTRTEQISNVWIFSVFGMLICTFLVYFHTVLLENQANHKQQEIIRLKEQNDAMMAQLAEVKTLANVEAKANKMGMVPAENFKYIAIESEQALSIHNVGKLDISSASYPIQPPVGF